MTRTVINLIAGIVFFYMAMNGIGNIIGNSIEKQSKTSLSDTQKKQFLENINPLHSSPTHSKSYLNLSEMPPPTLSTSNDSYEKLFQPLFIEIAVLIFIVFLVATIGAIRKKHKKPKQHEVINKKQTELVKSEAIKPENTRPFKSQNDKSSSDLGGGSTFIWSDDFIKSLEWKRFEKVCCEFLKIKGYNAEVTCVGADGGIDIVIKNNNDLVVSVAQCKAFGKKPINVSLIRELLGVMASKNIKKGLFFTTSTFSNDAVEFAKNNDISLVDLKYFVRSICALDSDSRERLYKIATKGDFTTPTCARCDVKMVKRVASTNKSEFYGCPNFPRCRMTINIRA